jgi:hypothetical protein
MATDTEVEKVLDDAASVELTYQQAINDEGTIGWVDDFIFNTCHPGGQTQKHSITRLCQMKSLMPTTQSTTSSIFPHAASSLNKERRRQMTACLWYALALNTDTLFSN